MHTHMYVHKSVPMHVLLAMYVRNPKELTVVILLTSIPLRISFCTLSS